MYLCLQRAAAAAVAAVAGVQGGVVAFWSSPSVVRADIGSSRRSSRGRGESS